MFRHTGQVRSIRLIGRKTVSGMRAGEVRGRKSEPDNWFDSRWSEVRRYNSAWQYRLLQGSFMRSPRAVAKQNPGGRRAGISRIEVVIIVVILLLGLGFLFPLVFQQRVQSRAHFCEKRQVDIYFATRRFESLAGELPSYRVNVAGPGAEPEYASWAYAVLPFLGVPYYPADPGYDPAGDQRLGPWAEIHAKFGVAATVEDRRELRKQYVPALVCPQDPPPGLDQGARRSWLSFVVNTGLADLPAADRQGPELPADWPANGVFMDRFDPASIMLPPVSRDSLEAGDGLENTLLLSENLDSGDWTDHEETRIGFLWVARFQGGPASWEKPLLQINQQGGTAQGSGKLAFARPSSRHPGGVLVVFASGRSMFLNANIDYRVYTYLMTSDDGQLKRPGFDEPLQWHTPPVGDRP